MAVTSNAGIDVFFQSGGGLGAPVSVPVEGGASDLISGDVRLSDMDGDGRADIVAAGLSRVVVIRSNADRTFQPAVTVVAARRKQIEVGDVTGDGRPDVVTREGLRTVIVYAQTTSAGTR